jgi:chromosome segregation ATPase
VVSSPRGRTRMVAHKTVDELREELLRADDDLERLRREAAHLRREIAERREALRDPEELSVALTAAEEQEAIIAWLEARREKLQRQLTGV